jgi:uncharacterized damage-inducible protein DinB
MSLSASLLPEFDEEMANLRKTLERVPEDKFDFKPHEKSGTLGWLANHLANMPGWGVMTMQVDELNVGPSNTYREPQATTTAGLLEILDKNVATAREAIAAATDEQLMQTWRLVYEGKEIFAIPRIAVLRSMVMNHMIHHRAQLGVYLRLNDVPVPALYGPTADEQAI